MIAFQRPYHLLLLNRTTRLLFNEAAGTWAKAVYFDARFEDGDGIRFSGPWPLIVDLSINIRLDDRGAEPPAGSMRCRSDALEQGEGRFHLSATLDIALTVDRCVLDFADAHGGDDLVAEVALDTPANQFDFGVDVPDFLERPITHPPVAVKLLQIQALVRRKLG